MSTVTITSDLAQARVAVSDELGTVLVTSELPRPVAVEVSAPQGDIGLPAYTLTLASYTQPALSASVTAEVESSAWVTPGAPVRSVAGVYTATAVDATHVSLVLVQALATAPGGTVASGVLLAPAGLAGADGDPGADGHTILSGTGAPSSGLGTDGDYYQDTAATRLYGPKTAGAWGSGVSLVGATGGDGLSVLVGSGAPSGALGVDGQAYVDTTGSRLYGPKTAGAWGAGTSIVGAAGIDGKTVRSGSGTPSNGLGVDGDFYINTTAITIYGPKASGAWGSPTSLIGTAGADGIPGSVVVDLVAESALTLSGEQTIDGVLTSGSRVLYQPAGTAAGIYVTSSGAWTRATDYDSATEIARGRTIYVASGQLRTGSLWTLTTAGTNVVGTTSLSFIQLTKVTKRTYTVAISGSSGSNTDTTLVSTPAGFYVTGIQAKLVAAPTGSGTAVLTAGVSTGGAELLAATTSVSSATVAPVYFGTSLSQLGTDMTAANGGWAFYSTAKTISARSAISGASLSGGVWEITIWGLDA